MGPCIRLPPLLTIQQTNFSTFLGDTFHFSYLLQNRDNSYCDFIQEYGGSPDKTGFMIQLVPLRGFSAEYNPGALVLGSGGSGSGNIFLNQMAHFSNNTLLNLTLQIYDPANRTYHGVNETIFVEIDVTCQRNPPLVVMGTIDLGGISIGESRFFTFNATITNQDTEDCPDSSFSISTSVPSPVRIF